MKFVKCFSFLSIEESKLGMNNPKIVNINRIGTRINSRKNGFQESSDPVKIVKCFRLINNPELISFDKTLCTISVLLVVVYLVLLQKVTTNVLSCLIL